MKDIILAVLPTAPLWLLVIMECFVKVSDVQGKRTRLSFAFFILVVSDLMLATGIVPS